jgi:hypothetical protein
MAAQKNFTVFKNEDWAYAARLKKPDDTYHDLVGTVMRMQVRPAEGSRQIIIDLNQTNGRLVFVPHASDTGAVKTVFAITVDKIALNNIKAGTYVFDIVWTRDDSDRRIIEGTVIISDGVTR